MGADSGRSFVGLGSALTAGSTPVGGVNIARRTTDNGPIAAPAVALRSDSTGSQIDAGTHVYALAPVTAQGEGQIGQTSATLTNDGTHTSSTVTVPALSGAITSYHIYRTKAGVTAPTIAQWFRLASSQAPGTYTDLATDASLPATNPSQTTLQNDDTLLFAVNASEKWFCEGWLFVNAANATMDIKFGWSVPTSTTMLWGSGAGGGSGVQGFVTVVPGTTPVALQTESGTVQMGTLAGTAGYTIGGAVTVSSTAGNVVLQWAQNTADAGAMKMLTGSFLRLTRLA